MLSYEVVMYYIPLMWFPRSNLPLICLSLLCSRFVMRRGRRPRKFCCVSAWCFVGMVSRGTKPHKPDRRMCAPHVIVAMIGGLRETMYLLHRDFASPRLTQVYCSQPLPSRVHRTGHLARRDICAPGSPIPLAAISTDGAQRARPRCCLTLLHSLRWMCAGP